jgi:hypothetical protein
MWLQALAIGLAAALASLTATSAARAAGNEVVIGDIDDLSGVYSDTWTCPVSVDSLSS